MRTLPGRLLTAAVLAAVAHTAPASGTAWVRPAPVPGAAAGSSPADERCEPGEPSIELVSPQAAIPLAAGSTAVLQWAPLPGLARLPAREEWEAFLSLDGGKTFSFRITPHLDADLRRALWEVPDVASQDVRLLLRFGDERRETVVELPQRFAIAAMPVVVGAPAALAARRGEAARPGDPGVVAWTEGSRRGAGRRQVVVVPAGLREGLRQPEPARGIVALTVRPAKAGPPAPARGGTEIPRRAAGAAPALARLALLPQLDRRLQTSRLNE